jgi:hypothetical protein
MSEDRPIRRSGADDRSELRSALARKQDRTTALTGKPAYVSRA